MNKDPDSLRERLLTQLPTLQNMAAYKAAVVETLERNQKRIRRERMFVTLFWIFCVASAVSYIWFGRGSAQVLPRGPFLACIFFTWGAFEMLKHWINSARIDLLKEIKQVQVQILELQVSRGEGTITQ
jgi:hypothetical protein